MVNKLFTKKKGISLVVLKIGLMLNENLKIVHFCTKSTIHNKATPLEKKKNRVTF